MLNTVAQCQSLQGPNAVELRQNAIPELQKGEVLVKVVAAALNFPDLLMTYGKYQFKPEPPFTIGMEGAGRVVACSPDVENFKIGANVMFRGKTGAVAAYKVAAVDDLSPMPVTLGFLEAAAFGVTFQTAYVALAKRGRLQRGETVLIHGSGGGVGQASVAVAKALGATVIATASSSEKMAIAKQSGADHVINYVETNFAEQVMSITRQQGVDLVLDPVGGEILGQSLACLAWQGRILTVGFASGSFGNVNLEHLQSLSGSIVGVRAGEYGRRNPEAGKIAFNEMLRLTEECGLSPYIGKTWELSEIVPALTSMQARSVIGKQVIRIDGSGLHGSGDQT